MDEFTKALLRALEEAERLGCPVKRLQKVARERGGAAAVKAQLCRGCDGFPELEVLGRLDLSPEALAVQGRFGALFTDEEINLCFSRLCAAGYALWKK